MNETDDQLQKFVEQNYDKLFQLTVEKFPDTPREDIDALMMGGTPRTKNKHAQIRGVKGTKGRPPVNKNILWGWVSLLTDIVGFSESWTRAYPPQLTPEQRLFHDIPLDLKLLPSGNWVYRKISELGLAYTIDEGANATRYPLTSPSTIKRHGFFKPSNLSGDLHSVDSFYQLQRALNCYLDVPPSEEIYFLGLLGHDLKQLEAGWQYHMQRRRTEMPEPWKNGFQITSWQSENGPTGPTMTLYFPPIEETTWKYLQLGIGLLGHVQKHKTKINPPSKERIREYKKNPPENPRSYYQDFFKFYFIESGS
jgi:hypothetical protein